MILELLTGAIAFMIAYLLIKLQMLFLEISWLRRYITKIISRDILKNANIKQPETIQEETIQEETIQETIQEETIQEETIKEIEESEEPPPNESLQEIEDVVLEENEDSSNVNKMPVTIKPMA